MKKSPNSPRPPDDQQLRRMAKTIGTERFARPSQLPMAGQRKGRYDEAIGPTMRDHYRAVLNDSKLLDLKDPLAAQDAIIARLMQRLDQGDSPDFRYRAIEISEALVAEVRNGGKDINYLANKLHDHLEKGAHEDRALRNLSVQIDRLRRGVVDAWKIKLGKRQAINARDLVGIMGTFLDVVRSETMPAIFSRIATRIDLEVFSGNGTLLVRQKQEVSDGREVRNGNDRVLDVVHGPVVPGGNPGVDDLPVRAVEPAGAGEGAVTDAGDIQS